MFDAKSGVQNKERRKKKEKLFGCVIVMNAIL